jgi:hypothetical protein
VSVSADFLNKEVQIRPTTAIDRLALVVEEKFA